MRRVYSRRRSVPAKRRGGSLAGSPREHREQAYNHINRAMAYADDGTEDGCLEAMFLLGAGSSEISYTPGADQTAYEREYNKAARHVETHCVVRPRGMMSALSARDTRRAMSSLNDWVVSAVSQGVRGELVFRTKKEAQQYIASVDPRQMKQIRLRPRR